MPTGVSRGQAILIGRLRTASRYSNSHPIRRLIAGCGRVYRLTAGLATQKQKTPGRKKSATWRLCVDDLSKYYFCGTRPDSFCVICHKPAAFCVYTSSVRVR
jgi:hypothetical protein